MLELYKKKRDFNVTSEPFGAKIKPQNERRFVIQHHFSRREHFDLRLEMNGVLLSWAVPKGMPESPADRRLAVRVEDHPLEYQYFQGTIPAGQYGAGKVEIWDAGTWQDEEPNGDKSKMFKFKLNGKRLNSSYALVRTKENNWILLKHSAAPINYQPKLLTLSSRVPIGNDWLYELKYDGVRCVAVVENGAVQLISRNNNPLKCPTVVNELATLKHNAIFDGELLGSSYVVFDILSLDGEDLREMPLLKRKEILKKTLPKMTYISAVEYYENFTQADFENLCRGNFEGIVAKRKDSKYITARNGDWVKVKCANYKRGKKCTECKECVNVTSPDKVVFTNPKITKGEIMEYYKVVAKYMLPYLRGRYLALVKCPNGVSNGCFYNKNNNNELLTVSCEQDILHHVQMNTLEFHAWASVGEKPDMMVFDLDPDAGLSIDNVRQGARDLKIVLDELGLKSFLKTSGGKGYHIVVRLDKGLGWDDFRDFAKNVAMVLEQKYPDKYTTNIRKDARAGKIFIDYLRNTRGATSVAPYSLRAKSPAAVSCPIFWHELDKIAPNEITMEKALSRLKTKDPWAELKLR
jgi:DNA ligase D-like protein (predicted polymerase)/DNA ligase D-like protein (predicted 3'-phosphoesterase)